MFKKLFTIIALAIFTSIYSQSFNFEKWYLGIGGGLVKFDDEDVKFIGDKHLSQIPRFNVTHKINEDFSADVAFSFGSFDSDVKLITTNNVPYFSFDVSGRYHFLKQIDKLNPYIFAGGSIIDSTRRTTPTINIGTGVTYWFSSKIGANTNVYYKHSLESFESMRSHFQFTLSIIFGFNSSKGRKGSTRCYYDLYK